MKLEKIKTDFLYVRTNILIGKANMLNKLEIAKLDDYFVGLKERRNKGAYFYRINGYNQQIHEFIQRYYEEARLKGVIIEGKLANPDNNNLSYYNEVMGMDFQLNVNFIALSLKKWLPRMKSYQHKNVAEAIYETIMNLKQTGKNENILRNAYVKFMCWLYYKFERIVDELGEEQLPKILYEGNVSTYELLMLNILATAGCDIILLEYKGDEEYLKIDPNSSKSKIYQMPGMTKFPNDFSLKQIQRDIQENLNVEKLYGLRPRINNCTNAWITGNIFEDVCKKTGMRGTDQKYFYNCYCRIMGVEDRLTYQNKLYLLQLELKKCKRNMVIISRRIEPPMPDEISAIHHKNYQNVNQLIMDLEANIHYDTNQELQRIMRKAFVDVILSESKNAEENINRLTSKAVYLLCWLKRYQQVLFKNWKIPEIACFFYMGGCRDDRESLFCKFLSKLPVDVLIFSPDLNQKCCLKDPVLYEVKYDSSLEISQYPEENTSVRAGTVAYHAERELDTLMYQDSGLYRNQQFEKANIILLQTMYEEIPILWNQELKYRPNFSAKEDFVNMPVIYSKVCGVKDADLQAYWFGIKKLITDDTIVIKNVPQVTSISSNPIKAYATDFYKNGKIQRKKIKGHKTYRYGFLRESMQEYILDKLQLLIEQKVIKGTFENGTEYTVISVVLNLETNILRLIQKFDFTKKNPKLIYIITGETGLSLEDSIIVSFLNLIGFDILFFVPTGYQCIEKYFNDLAIEEHQIGEYQYDLSVPDFAAVSENENANTRPSWREFIFKRGI